MDDNIIPYWVIRIDRTRENSEILNLLSWSDSLAGSEEREDYFLFYIPSNQPEAMKSFERKLEEHGIEFRKETESPKNWNEEWEKSFKPVEIGKTWYIRAPFHSANPEFKRDLAIAPRMAFGTGHHPTTAMMLKLMDGLDFSLKRVLDLGCGSGILSIAAEKLGAAKVKAVDYDPICVENSRENISLNNCANIAVHQGEISDFEGLRFDIILANINLNVIIGQLKNMEDLLFPGGELLLSGILQSDKDNVVEKSEALELIQTMRDGETDWICMHFRKKVIPIKTP